jgi:integrase
MDLSRGYRAELERMGWSELHRRRSVAVIDSFLSWTRQGGVKTVEALTARDGLAWLHVGGWTGKTGRNRVSVLRSFGDWLETSGKSVHNPFRAIKLPRVVAARGAEPFELEEIRVLLRTVRKLEGMQDRRRGRFGPLRSTFYAFLALTGLRHGEACAQEWADIDLPGAAFVVTRDKARRRDVLPLCTEAVELLERWTWWSPQGGLVFPVTPSHKTLRRDLERAGIARGRGEWHRFRKAAITERARRSGTYREVQAFARHTDPRITLGVYDRVKLEEVRPVAEAMPSLFGFPERVSTNGARGGDKALVGA